MPDLLQSLMEQDFGFLQIIADFWHVESPVWILHRNGQLW